MLNYLILVFFCLRLTLPFKIVLIEFFSMRLCIFSILFIRTYSKLVIVWTGLIIYSRDMIFEVTRVRKDQVYFGHSFYLYMFKDS